MSKASSITATFTQDMLGDLIERARTALAAHEAEVSPVVSLLQTEMEKNESRRREVDAMLEEHVDKWRQRPRPATTWLGKFKRRNQPTFRKGLWHKRELALLEMREKILDHDCDIRCELRTSKPTEAINALKEVRQYHDTTYPSLEVGLDSPPFMSLMNFLKYGHKRTTDQIRTGADKILSQSSVVQEELESLREESPE